MHAAAAFRGSSLGLAGVLEQAQIGVEAEAPVAGVAGDLAQQADALEAVDDLVGAGRGQAQPFAGGGDGDEGGGRTAGP